MKSDILRGVEDPTIERLRKLREVDLLVDIGRGSVQLEIILALGRADSGLNSKSLSEMTGYRRKTILDALRKLQIKGLVSEREDGYVLSEKGLKLYSSLLEALGVGIGESKGRLSSMLLSREMARDIATYDYVNDAIIALGAARNYELPVKVLSEITGLSVQRLEDYLEKFTNGRPRLFKKFRKRSILSKILGRGEVYYRLTSEGLAAYHKLPHYLKMKKNLGARILQTIGRSGHPKLVLKRMAIYMSIGSSLTMLAAILIGGALGKIIMASWILLVSLIALLIEVSY